MAGKISKAVKIYSYARTLQSKSEYANRMDRLSKQIFGEVARPTSEKGMDLVKTLSREPFEKKEYYTQYYPAVEEATELFRILRDHGLYRDEHADFKEAMAEKRAARGKARMRPRWKDGVKPEKVVKLRYDD